MAERERKIGFWQRAECVCIQKQQCLFCWMYACTVKWTSTDVENKFAGFVINERKQLQNFMMFMFCLVT
jgi:hypothetical protein